MRLSRNVRGVLIAQLCFGMILPATPLPADEPAVASPGSWIVDVQLRAGNVLHGTVLDDQGAPRPHQPVLVRGQGTRETRIVSDPTGQFQIALTGGGSYQLAAGDQILHVRCWQPGTAPPHAANQVVLGGGPVVRGQVPPSCCGLTNPWVIAGLTVAAIAIPVALYQNRDDRQDASE